MVTLAASFDVLTSPEWRPLVEKVVCGLIGVFAALLGSYFVLARDVSYIKGKLEDIGDSNARIEALAGEHKELRSDLRKLKRQFGVSSHG